MAVDKKSDYVGNHGGTYVDIDGNTRQFTYVDYDRKLPSRISGGETKETLKEKAKRLAKLKKSIKDSKVRRIKEILALPPMFAAIDQDTILDKLLYREFVLVEEVEGKPVISWNEKSLTEACMLNDTLRSDMWTRVWRNTVKQDFWYEDMEHEDILKGEWKKWT